MSNHVHDQTSQNSTGHYSRLFMMLLLSFAAMYGLMYAMVNKFAEVYHNVNQVYMAGLMAAAMLLIELVLMARMYPNRRLNISLIAGAVILGAICWMGIRRQVAVGDGQFLRSMIPHHSGAVLMCQEAAIERTAIRELCAQIIASQEREIALMKQLLAEQ